MNAARSLVTPKLAPLSFEQEHLWSVEYVPNIPPMALMLDGPLDIDALEYALRCLVARHEILRTLFRSYDGHPWQEIFREFHIDLACEDLEALGAQEQHQAARDVLQRETVRPFNLSEGPLLRAGLLRLSETQHILYFTLHHIVSDLWSFKVFLRELSHLYTCGVNRETPSLRPLRFQYADYAEWQRKWWQGELVQKEMAYWADRLKDLPTLDLPTDQPRTGSTDRAGEVASLVISADVGQQLIQMSRQHAATLFMTVLTAFKILLCRCTGQNDIAVSVLVANRNRPEVEPLIGVFANRLVLRTDVTGNPTFRQLLGRVRDVCFGAYAHQSLSFWQVAKLRPALISSQVQPNVVFTLQDVPVEPQGFYGLRVLPFECNGNSLFEGAPVTTTGRYDQEWQVWRNETELRFVVCYRTTLFRRSSVKLLLDDFQAILTTIAANVDACVQDIALTRRRDR